MVEQTEGEARGQNRKERKDGIALECIGKNLTLCSENTCNRKQGIAMLIHFCKERGARHQAELVPWLCSQVGGNGSFEDDKMCYHIFSSPHHFLRAIISSYD